MHMQRHIHPTWYMHVHAEAHTSKTHMQLQAVTLTDLICLLACPPTHSLMPTEEHAHTHTHIQTEHKHRLSPLRLKPFVLLTQCRIVQPAPDCTMAPKAKSVAKGCKVSQKKTMSTLTFIGSGQKDDDKQKQLQELIDACLADDDLLLQCRGIMTKRKSQKEQEVDRLPRGARAVGLLAAYNDRRIMVHLTKTNPSIWENMCAEDVKTFVIWVLGGDPDYRLPELRMLWDPFTAWAMQMYIQCGERLNKVDMHLDESSLDWTLGVVGMVYPEQAAKDAGDDEDVPVTEIVRHEDGLRASLPVGFQPPLSDVGDVWRLHHNYNFNVVHLKNCKTLAQIHLHTLFVPSQVVHGGRWMDG